VAGCGEECVEGGGVDADEDGSVGVGRLRSGDRDAVSVGGGPVERFDGGWIVDGEDGGNACLSEGAKTAAGVGFAVGWCQISGGVVEEDGDLSLEVEICGGHAVAEEDHGGFDNGRLFARDGGDVGGKVEGCGFAGGVDDVD